MVAAGTGGLACSRQVDIDIKIGWWFWQPVKGNASQE
jgi:hypothetical protein